MGVRSALASGFTRAAKAFGGSEPAAMEQAARDTSQMTMDHAFAPGEPVGPYDGYSRTPRQFDFTTGYNIATRPRTHERVSFETLRGLVESYDVAQICIHHRIDSLRSLDWNLTAADWYTGDVSDAVALGMKALRKPDGINSFETWFAKWMYDVLAYDAGALYRLRNRAGRVVGLLPVDGCSIAPLLDYWGNSPQPPAEAYVQYVNGLPWGWLTRDDLVYEPFRPRNNSPYGHAPLESIMLNANTDIRFQIYFLQRFTEGNIPEAFASAPESWSPDQIELWQTYWDSFMYGEQSAKHQIKWMPGGSTIAWSNEKDFSDIFSLHLMRKTTAAYHVVPTDIGFTENSNYSTGESQADVGHRVGDLPLGRYAEQMITGFLQDDLGLPIKHQFDWGDEEDDRAAQAQADDVYAKLGVIGPSELRQMRFGLDEPEGKSVPRFIFTTRAGPIPLSSLFDVAGPVDDATSAPEPGVPLPHKEFQLVEGVVPVPPPPAPALAERLYGPGAVPPALPAPPPAGAMVPDGSAVSKEDGGAAGITSETGVYGYDGPGHRDDDDEDEQAGEEVRKALARDELAAFRRFEKGRRKAGTWRDFTFAAVSPVSAHRLNDAGRLAVRKAAGEIAVAGLAVQAQDTGRVLMLQRALDPDDPAGGTWEFPGGHLEEGESPLQAAWREWAEETGAIPPPGQQAGTWAAGNGIYQGVVWQVPSEDCVPVRSETLVANPDDPDGDQVEAIAWWSPADLPGNAAVRPELLADIDAVMAALGCGQAEPAGVAKAGGAAPKAVKVEAPGLPDSVRPAIIRRRERLIREHLGTVQTAWDAAVADLSPRDLVREFRQDVGTVAKAAATDQQWWKNAATAAAVAWLAGLYQSRGYAALVAAIADAIRSGMAEGEADALAAAAARQGVAGLNVAEAFAQAYGRLQGDPGVSQRAQETLEAIVAGAAADLGRQLAADAGDGKGEQDMTASVRSVVTGAVRSVRDWLTNGVWAALGAGVKGLLSRVLGAGATALLDWQTDGAPCAACVDNEAGSPYAPEDVPSYPAHNHCECELVLSSDIPSSFFAGLLG